MGTMEQAYITLRSEAGQQEIALEEVEEFLMAPQVIPVPCPPDGIAGMLEYRGALIPAFCLGGDAGGTADAAACSAVLRNQDGTFYAILAGEIS